MNQTFANSENGQEMDISILHKFETADEYGRNLIVFRDKNELKLAFVTETTIEIIKDTAGLEDICNKSLEQLKKLENEGNIDEKNLKKVEYVFNDLNISLSLDRLSKNRADAEKERVEIAKLSTKKEKDEIRLENVKHKLEDLEKELVTLNQPIIYTRDNQADGMSKQKEALNKAIDRCKEQIMNLERIIATAETDIMNKEIDLDSKRMDVEQEEIEYESLKQQAIVKLSRNVSREELDNIKFIFEKKCENYINGEKNIDIIDASFKDNIEKISENIKKYKFDIAKKNSIIEKIEYEKEAINEHEKQLIYNFKQEVINELKTVLSGAQLKKAIEYLDNYKGILMRPEDKQKLDDRKAAYQQLLIDTNYNSLVRSKKDDEIKLREEQEKYDRKIKSSVVNYLELDDISKKNQTYLQLVQFATNLKMNREKMSPEEKIILNRYEELKRKQLANEYKLEKDKKTLSKLNTQADKALYKKMFANKHMKKDTKIEAELAEIIASNQDLISKSIYSNDSVCNALIYDKQIRKTSKYLENYIGYTKEGRIELKRAIEQAKREKENKQQQAYREIQRKNIEYNDKALLDEQVRETSLDKIVKKDKNIITRFKNKTKSTKLYKKIISSKIVTKIADSEIAFATKRSFIEKGLKIKSFRQDMNEFADMVEHRNENERRR